MKYFQIVLIALFFSVTGFSQSEKTTFKISDNLRDSRYSYLIDASSKGNYIYTIRSTGNITKREYTIQQFDGGFNLRHEKAYEGRDLVPTDFVVLNDQIFLVEVRQDRKKKTQQWSMRKINEETFRLEGDRIQLSKQERARGNILNSNAVGYLLPQFTYSPDSSKVMMFFEFETNRQNQDKTFQAIVLNESLEKIYKEQISLPYLNRNFDIEGFYVSNEGDVYIIGGKENVKGLSQKTREMVLHKFGINGSEKSKIFALNKARNEFTGISLYDESDNNLRLVGFIETRGRLSGLHFFELSQDLKLIKQKYHEVSSDQFISTEIQDQIRGSKRNVRRYEYTGHIAAENNAVIITAEKREITQRLDNRGVGLAVGGGTVTTMFNYDDIFICKVEEDFTLNWMRLIPKRQRWENNDQFLSFKTKLVGNDLHVVYLDDMKNLEPGIRNLRTLSAGDRRRMVLVDAKVDLESGKLDRDIIFSPFNEDTYPLLSSGVDGNPKELIFFAKRGKNDRIVNVNFY
jgi:hypothetical protein